MPNSSIELTEYKAVQGQVNIDEAQGIVEAFVAGIGNKDSVGDIIVTGAFNDSLKRRKPRVVWGHNWNEPIGKVLEIYEVPKSDPRLPAKMKAAGIGGVYARVQFNLKSERGRQAFADVAFFGEEQEWSIGYKTLDADFDPQMQANILKKVELYEVSPVLHGANQLTGTISIKADQPLRDPKGGLTAAGRRHFARTEGAKLKPGVKGPADTPEKMRRKGSFLTRFFTNPSGPMKDDNGKPTRLALSAAAWGEPVPQDRSDAAALAAKGRRLLQRYENTKKKKKSEMAQLEQKALEIVMADPMFKQSQQHFVYQELESKGLMPTPKAMDRSMLERMVRTMAMERFKKQRVAAVLRALMQNARPEEEEEDEDDKPVNAENPMLGRSANLASALAERYGGAVRIRESDANQVIFDHRGDMGETTMRVSYHYEDGQFMFGDATQVKPKVVFISMNSDQSPSTDEDERNFVDRYNLDENPQVPAGVLPKWPAKADPLGGLVPQEMVTAQTRGYGPRRGNLEKLLRYWRPIMKKPGGFRRCRVILANHPELYPLNNICAWLHHETTGLWPNEGCHHPGMKNCRKKIRGVVNGSIWDDNEWNARLRKLTGKKEDGSFDMSDVMDVFGDMGSDEKNMMMMEEVGERLAVGTLPDYETDDEEEGNKQAYEALREFMNEEPKFISYMTGDDNWVMEGEDDDGETIEMPLSGKPGGCGCGGDGDGDEMLEMVMAILSSMTKDAEQDIEVKAGRTISGRNMQKLRQAYALLNEVLVAGGEELESKTGFLIEAELPNVFKAKELLDPVLTYYGIESEATEYGVKIFDIADINDDAYEAIFNVVSKIDKM